MARFTKIGGAVLKTEKLADPKKFNVGAYSKAVSEDAGAMVPVKALQEFYDLITNKSGKGKAWDDCTVALGVHSGNLIVTGKAKNGEEETLLVKKGYDDLKAKKAVVINADTKDDIINTSTTKMAKAKGVKENTLDDADLSTIKGDLIILAHGGSKGSKPGKVYCDKFANKSAADIIKYLIKTKPLPKSYDGVVYLDGCFTAAGASKGTSLKDLNNFAGKVYKGLNSAGYKYLQVKGNLGEAATNEDGSESIKDAQAEAAIKKHAKMLKPFDDALKKAELECSQSINRLENKYGPALAKQEKLESEGSKEEKEAAKEAIAKLKKAKKKEIDEAVVALEKVQKTTLAAYRKVGVADKNIKELVGTFGPAALPT